jgi:hypothetical protein
MSGRELPEEVRRTLKLNLHRAFNCFIAAVVWSLLFIKFAFVVTDEDDVNDIQTGVLMLGSIVYGILCFACCVCGLMMVTRVGTTHAHWRDLVNGRIKPKPIGQV